MALVVTHAHVASGTDAGNGEVHKAEWNANHVVSGTLSADDTVDGTTNKVFTATEKTKLSGIASGATANSSDATLLARANHTGTQTASTISDFNTAADARITAATGSSIQPYDADLTTLGGLSKTDGNFIVADGAAWTVESGATARASLGLTIGTDVQAYDTGLAELAAITAATGDIIYGDGADSWTKLGIGSTDRVLSVAGGVPVWAMSRIGNIVYDTKTDTFSTTSTSFTDLTGLSVSITPSSSSSRILLLAAIVGATSTTTNGMFMKFIRNTSTDILLGDAAGSRIQSHSIIAGQQPANSYTLLAIDSPATTSATTYKVQVAVTTGTGYVNRGNTDTDSSSFGRYASSLIAVEII